MQIGEIYIMRLQGKVMDPSFRWGFEDVLPRIFLQKNSGNDRFYSEGSVG
jgi:hypothetical protein